MNPAVGQTLIPRNYGIGPGLFSVNLGLSRAFAFGNAPSSAAVTQPPAGGKKAAPAEGTSKPGGNPPASANQSAAAKPGNGPAPEKRYNLTFSVNIQNLLNRTNLNQPIGNLSSPRFGESTATVGGFGFGPGGSAAAGNRCIQLQVRFTF